MDFDYTQFSFDEYTRYLNRRVTLDELFEAHDLTLTSAGERDAIKRGPDVWLDYISRKERRC